MTKLEAIRLIAQRTGRRPPAAMETNGIGMAADIERVLDDEELRIQQEGWAYNVRVNVTIVRDSNTRIPLPTGTLWIDTDREDVWRDVTQLGGFLYDRENNVDTFDGDLRCTYCLRYEFDCIPSHVQEYIVACTAAQYNLQYGSPMDKKALYYPLEEQQVRSKVKARQIDGDIRDVNLLKTAEARRILGDRNSGYGFAAREPMTGLPT